MARQAKNRRELDKVLTVANPTDHAATTVTSQGVLHKRSAGRTWAWNASNIPFVSVEISLPQGLLGSKRWERRLHKRLAKIAAAHVVAAVAETEKAYARIRRKVRT